MKHIKNFLESSNKIPKKAKAHKLRKRETRDAGIRIVKLICENLEVLKMDEIIKINNHDVAVKEYKGQRVVTFKDIDTVHERPDGTAKRNFNDNKKHFIEGEDFFAIPYSEFCTEFVPNPPKGGNPNVPVNLMTEQGYLMLVKSLTDDLAWKVQRELVNAYFEVKEFSQEIPKDYPSALRLAADEYEKRLLEEQKNGILQKENDLLAQKTLEWADRPIINALVREYSHSIDDDYKGAWREFKKELLYRYGINLNARQTAHLNKGGNKSKAKLDFLNDDELPQAISTAVAMCRNNNVDISEIIEKKAS